MTFTIPIKQSKNYELHAKVQALDYWPGKSSVELFQCFPEAQRPRWQRILQLTLTKEEAQALSDAIAP